MTKPGTGPATAADARARAFPMRPPIAAPSVLSADFSRLGAELSIVDPARDWVHCDIMDNHFVPNLTFGPILVGAIHRLTPAFLDVHLMIENPESLITPFRDAGANLITMHVEALGGSGGAPSPERVRAAIARVRDAGVLVGLSIKPGTPFDAALPYLSELDLLLVMTVEPGFGGQAFREEMLPKVRAAAEWKRAHQARLLIEVDGGIHPETARATRAAGAEVFVAGSAVFSGPDPARALAELRGAL